METSIKLFSKIFLGITLIIFTNAVFTGITTQPSEGDSLAYHIPIARSLIDGTTFSPNHIEGALGYYPGASEIILAQFILFGIPLNLYNVLAWSILIVLCFKLGIAYKLSSDTSIIFAITTTSVLSFIHLLNNQTIDIWLAVFFTWALILLQHPRKTLSFMFQLGIALGMLVGSKYSGPAYVVLLLLAFWHHLKPVISLKSVLVFFIPFSIFGLSWYIRNIYLTGNPLYPQELLFIQGDPAFELMKWTGIHTLIFVPFGVIKMGFALFSEYLLLSISPLIAVYVLFLSRVKKISIEKDTRILLLVGLCNFALFFFLPSTSENIITYLRYLFPAFIPLVLVTFLMAQKYNYLLYLFIFSLINSMLILTQFPYRPKLFLLIIVIYTIVIWVTDKSVRKVSGK